MMVLMPCCLCSDPAIAIFLFPQGCYAYPNKTLQPLCPSHIRKAQPRGSMELLEDLRADRSEAIPELYLPAEGKH